MNHSTIQTAELFNVARETIRKWAIEFESYLSATARPPEGGVRRFTVEDIEVFALVAEMKEQGKVFDDIHAALRSGQRGQIPDNPSALASVPNNPQLVLTTRIDELEETVAVLTLKLSQADQARARAEGRENLLQEMLKDAHTEIARLNRMLGPGKSE